MKFRVIAALVLACVCAAGAAAATAQDNKGGQAEAKVSGGERDAAEKINKAKGAEAKLQAAAEFVKKYPKSSLRPKVAQAVAGEIANTQDNQLKVSLAQTYLGFFNEPGEAEQVNNILLDAYINGGQTEDAFKLAGTWLASHPDDVNTMHRLAVLASNAAIQGNNSFNAQGTQYGKKAVELLEADKMPAGADPAQWATYKASALPALYRALGVIAFKTNDRAAARAALEKAAALGSKDPGVYLLLSDLTYGDYDQLAKEYQVLPAGAEKQAALKKVEAQLDKVIDTYAHAIAMTEGNPQYQPAHDQMVKDIENYYKFRHNGSTEGLQQVIDKYKKPATP